jgi:hypothetical protein
MKDVEDLDRLVNEISLPFFLSISTLNGARGGVVVKALRYKPAGREFDSRWCIWNFSVTSPSGYTMALGSTQPLIEMSTRCISLW